VVTGLAAKAGAWAGIAGPALFTSAWLVSSLRQTGHPAADIQISGLAAPDARDSWIMIAGFLVLGGCSLAFGAALQDGLGGRGQAGPAPRLIQGAGVLTVAAGLLRRDHMLLTPGSVSWHNHAHDVISAVIYADLVVAQLVLARRFGRDAADQGQAGQGKAHPGWRRWRPWLLASAGLTAGSLTAFAAGTSASDAAILQRVAVIVPLAVTAAIAIRLTRRSPARPAGQSIVSPDASAGISWPRRLLRVRTFRRLATDGAPCQ
jgi:drug/metabolite transporter (DMT)-like permease